MKVRTRQWLRTVSWAAETAYVGLLGFGLVTVGGFSMGYLVIWVVLPLLVDMPRMRRYLAGEVRWVRHYKTAAIWLQVAGGVAGFLGGITGASALMHVGFCAIPVGWVVRKIMDWADPDDQSEDNLEGPY